jgi:geranylgeranyl reductase family protein
MLTCDALIVGGGPAGSACAGALRREGWDVRVIDQAQFPRDKVCGGWIPPQVFALLGLQPADYVSDGLTLDSIQSFRVGMVGGEIRDVTYGAVVSYTIRRAEFDAFLLRRAQVSRIELTPVVSIGRDADQWVINGMYRAPVLVGAGGHFCPVARFVRGGGHDHSHPIVAREAEIPRTAYTCDDPSPLLLFCHDFDGYGWCLPKSGYVNIGLGHRDSRAFPQRFREFLQFLTDRDLVPRAASVTWRGHAYLAQGAGARPLLGDRVLLIGDAAGLAYPVSGEGIRPAIESGLIAARTLITADGHYDRESLQPYADAMTRAHPRVVPGPYPLRIVERPIGRALLSMPFFTKHVVLDRWFLRPAAAQVSS